MNCNNSFPENKPSEVHIYGDGTNLDYNAGPLLKPKDIKNNVKNIRVFYKNQIINF